MIKEGRTGAAFAGRFSVRFFIGLVVITLALSASVERNQLARSEAAVSSTAFESSEIFEACQMPGVAQPPAADLAGGPVAGNTILGGDISPARYVMDPYPTFNGIAVDGVNGKVLMSDSNRKGLLLYNRTSGSLSRDETSPERQIMGPSTLLGYVAGVAIDAERREIYGVNNDIEDNLSVFSYDDNGDLKPKRVLAVPHQAWGIVLGRSRDELAVTVERANALVVYRREAQGVEPPLRSIKGSNTGLADPHGVAWDQVNKEIVVANHGHKSSDNYRGPAYQSVSPEDSRPTTSPSTSHSTRQSFPPSITIYPETAEGDAKPARTIEGTRTQLAWPMGLDVDPERNEIVVANNADNSVLFFSRTASGDIAPLRIIRGSRTGINRPMGVAVDRKNNELWVANYGNHSAVVFGLTASGNIAPKRVIRNAPAATPTAGLGNPMAVAFDVKREEILVPN